MPVDDVKIGVYPYVITIKGFWLIFSPTKKNIETETELKRSVRCRFVPKKIEKKIEKKSIKKNTHNNIAKLSLNSLSPFYLTNKSSDTYNYSVSFVVV